MARVVPCCSGVILFFLRWEHFLSRRKTPHEALQGASNTTALVMEFFCNNQSSCCISGSSSLLDTGQSMRGHAVQSHPVLARGRWCRSWKALKPHVNVVDHFSLRHRPDRKHGVGLVVKKVDGARQPRCIDQAH
jgi:hypothetical protein